MRHKGTISEHMDKWGFYLGEEKSTNCITQFSNRGSWPFLGESVKLRKIIRNWLGEEVSELSWTAAASGAKALGWERAVKELKIRSEGVKHRKAAGRRC